MNVPLSQSIQAGRVLDANWETATCDRCGSRAPWRALASFASPSDIALAIHRKCIDAVTWPPSGRIDFRHCRGCGIVFMTPRLTEAGARRFYDAFYDSATDLPYYASSWTDLERARLDWIAQFAQARSSIIDVGCGTGSFLAAARAAGYRVYGVDVSEIAVTHARKERQLDADVGDIASLVASGRRSDVITMFSVLEHLRDPLDALSAAAQIVQRGGLFVFNVPNYASADRAFCSIVGRAWPGFIVEHNYYFSATVVRRMLADVGFAVVRMNSNSPVPRGARGTGPVVSGGRPKSAVTDRVVGRARTLLEGAFEHSLLSRHSIAGNFLHVVARRV